jgi:hypothetical protein
LLLEKHQTQSVCSDDALCVCCSLA